jgi:predicted RNase H-like nuclease (RuvC/YqgF family)
MKEQMRSEVSMREQSLIKEVRQKCVEIEELRKKARKRKEKVRALQRENTTLKTAIRDLEIKSVLQ